MEPKERALQCLRDKQDRFLKDQKLLHAFSKFAGIQSVTVSCWLKTNTMASGVTLYRVLTFFEGLGCKVEFPIVDEQCLKLRKLLVFGVISSEDAEEALQVNDNSIRRYMAGKQHFVGAGVANMEALASMYQDSLEKKEAEFARMIAGFKGAASTESDLHEADAGKSAGSVSHEVVARVALHAIETLLEVMPIIDKEFTDEERYKIREAIRNGEGVYRLSILMNRFCSRQAREMIKQP